jgi:hypothetical protein
MSGGWRRCCSTRSCPTDPPSTITSMRLGSSGRGFEQIRSRFVRLIEGVGGVDAFCMIATPHEWRFAYACGHYVAFAAPRTPDELYSLTDSFREYFAACSVCPLIDSHAVLEKVPE